MAGSRFVCGMFLGVATLLAAGVQAQDGSGLDRVLTLSEERTGPHSLAVDRGAAGLWQRLQRLRTTGSALYTAAHPDDEQGGTLALLSRGQGIRMAMLTLNRGEGGANAIGSELFEGLGLIRSEELKVAGRYYGLDDQYFTSLIDYGYSKSMDEAFDQWGRENVLRDVVRIIRINRPLILISRFYGGPRDGHGNHEAAGVITQEAFQAAGDPDRFPEQIREEGLRAWQPLKMYRSNLRSRRSFGVRATPPEQRWNVRVNVGRYSSWLGESYQQFADLGLSFQRSQNSGRRRDRPGEAYQYFERLQSRVDAAERESGFFDSINTSLPGVYQMLGVDAPEGGIDALLQADRHLEDAVAAFNLASSAAVVPSLGLGLEKIREALQLSVDLPDAVFMLRIKERQCMDAISTALGLQFRALAVSAATQASASPFAPQRTLGVIVPGQQFQVETSLVNTSSLPIRVHSVQLDGPQEWGVEGGLDGEQGVPSGRQLGAVFHVTAPSGAEPARRYFYRESVRDSRYQVRDREDLHLPERGPALLARTRYTVGGQPVELTAVVYRREANLPFGYEYRKLKIAPAVAVNLKPDNVIVPVGGKRRSLTIEVDVLNNQPDGTQGSLRLDAPQGWRVEPPESPIRFTQAGERRSFTFSVTLPRIREEDYRIEAVATAAGKDYKEGYDIIRHRDYDLRYQYREAAATVRGLDVRMASGLRVGYVMGVGDDVPSGIRQLGAEVTLLLSEHLATGDLARFDVIVIGTRAYAVRQDLITYNQRLLDYARAGGHLIVLYQTQEFVPEKWAAFPARLPRNAEEVSEEDSAVTILAPDHPVFHTPNRIGPADFDDWVEQRGSKFFTEWDPAYVAMIETQDRRQEPQRGGWLMAEFGRGHYTYFAYAIHRQVPYGVAGPYRIFANLLSLGR